MLGWAGGVSIESEALDMGSGLSKGAAKERARPPSCQSRCRHCVSGRRAYPGTPVTEIIRQLGFSGPLMDALKDVRLDGEQLLAIGETLRTPRRFEMRAETKYREAFAAAVAFAGIMGVKQLDISSVHSDGDPRESPDLLLSGSGSLFDVEVVRVDETSETRAHLFELQARTAALLTDEPNLKPETLTTFMVDYEAMKDLNEAERKQLAEELCDFFRMKRWQFLPKGAHTSVFASDGIAARVGTVVRIASPSYAAALSFGQADEMTPYQLILSEIERKRQLRYAQSHELWLVVEVADPRGPFTKAINAVGGASPQIAPFDHIFVYDALSLSYVIM
jgi:hypothetical protein